MKVHDMSSTLQPVNAYALVLEEVNGNRKLPVIIGGLEALSIKVVMMRYKTPRPLTHDLFLSTLDKLGVVLRKVLIYKVRDGVYYSYLFLEKDRDSFGKEEIQVDARTSDAIALAMRCGCPIYTTAEIMDSEYLREAGDSSFAVSVNLVDLAALKEALAKAIEEENYEQASRLRDEIRRREKENETK